jgi:DNA-binding NarL/FixJ family response regulator
VREALTLGAVGYVVKRKVGSDLLTALDAFLDGKPFVSAGVSAQEFTTQATITSLS